MAKLRHKRALRPQNTTLSVQRRLFTTGVFLSSLVACLYPMQVVAGQTAWKGTMLTGDNGWQEISVQAGDKSMAGSDPEIGSYSGLDSDLYSGSGRSTRSSGNLTSGKASSLVSRRAPFTIINAVATPTAAPTSAPTAAPTAASTSTPTTVLSSEELPRPTLADTAATVSDSRQIRIVGVSPATVNVDLFVGEVKVLGQYDVERVAVGNGAIIKAEVIDSGELLVIASAPGSSSLRLWNNDGSQSDYNIRVSQSDPETRVRMERMVRMRVRMVEFRKSALGRLGIDWGDSAAGPGLAAAGEIGSSLLRPATEGFNALTDTVAPFSAYFGIASNITSRIHFLAQNGDAVTLAEPVLSAMNGGVASFLAGGEVPYPSIGENGQTIVEFKEYGVKLNIAPLIDGAGNVRAKLETEISQLDSSVTVQGAPGLLTRRAQTEVTVRSGQTIVISGLLSSENSADADEIPGLGRLPIIGRFFGTKNERKSVSELVIFVTPEVIEPGAPMISARETRYKNESDMRVGELRQQLPLME